MQEWKEDASMELEKIKAIIAEVLNIDADTITADTTFVDHHGD